MRLRNSIEPELLTPNQMWRASIELGNLSRFKDEITPLRFRPSLIFVAATDNARLRHPVLLGRNT